METCPKCGLPVAAFAKTQFSGDVCEWESGYGCIKRQLAQRTQERDEARERIERMKPVPASTAINNLAAALSPDALYDSTDAALQEAEARLERIRVAAGKWLRACGEGSTRHDEQVANNEFLQALVRELGKDGW